MSLADTLVSSTTAAYAVVHDDLWTVLGEGGLAGVVFSGDAQAESPFILETGQGEDNREKTMLHVSRPAPPLESNMLLQGKGVRWCVIAVDDNPVNDRVKFTLVRSVEQKGS